MKYFFSLSLIFLFLSCSNSGNDDKKIDSMFPQKAPVDTMKVPNTNSSKDSSDVKSVRLSPKDSARVADSLFNSKNPVRDFN
jgi:hypothetical protein